MRLKRSRWHLRFIVLAFATQLAWVAIAKAHELAQANINTLRRLGYNNRGMLGVVDDFLKLDPDPKDLEDFSQLFGVANEVTDETEKGIERKVLVLYGNKFLQYVKKQPSPEKIDSFLKFANTHLKPWISNDLLKILVTPFTDAKPTAAQVGAFGDIIKRSLAGNDESAKAAAFIATDLAKYLAENKGTLGGDAALDGFLTMASGHLSFMAPSESQYYVKEFLKAAPTLKQVDVLSAICLVGSTHNHEDHLITSQLSNYLLTLKEHNDRVRLGIENGKRMRAQADPTYTASVQTKAFAIKTARAEILADRKKSAEAATQVFRDQFAKIRADHKTKVKAAEAGLQTVIREAESSKRAELEAAENELHRSIQAAEESKRFIFTRFSDLANQIGVAGTSHFGDEAASSLVNQARDIVSTASALADAQEKAAIERANSALEAAVPSAGNRMKQQIVAAESALKAQRRDLIVTAARARGSAVDALIEARLKVHNDWREKRTLLRANAKIAHAEAKQAREALLLSANHAVETEHRNAVAEKDAEARAAQDAADAVTNQYAARAAALQKAYLDKAVEVPAQIQFDQRPGELSTQWKAAKESRVTSQLAQAYLYLAEHPKTVNNQGLDHLLRTALIEQTEMGAMPKEVRPYAALAMLETLPVDARTRAWDPKTSQPIHFAAADENEQIVWLTALLKELNPHEMATTAKPALFGFQMGKAPQSISPEARAKLRIMAAHFLGNHFESLAPNNEVRILAKLGLEYLKIPPGSPESEIAAKVLEDNAVHFSMVAELQGQCIESAVEAQF